MLRVSIIIALAFALPASRAASQDCDSINSNSSASDITSCVTALNKTLSELKAKVDSIPPGAVIILDRPGGCPNGWADMGSKWRGRSIVVAVSDPNDKYGFGRRGGEESHILTENEMPRHRHPLRYGDGQELSAGRIKYIIAAGGLESASAYVGGNAAHNNMPPYLALYFCKKN